MEDRPDKALQGIDAIIKIEAGSLCPYVPPLTDYTNPSANWSEAEYRCLEAGSEGVTVGYWQGEPGEVSFEAWPYTEVCSILSGRVGLRDGLQRIVTFGAGEGFIVPQGWRGSWLTLQPATKIFMAIK